MVKVNFIREKSNKKKTDTCYSKLFDYVDSEFKKGKTRDDIKENLMRVGWPELTIEEALEEVESNAIIKISNISKRFGNNIIFKDVNLKIREGEIFGIIGLSGSGKTTLLNTLVGFLQADSGKILFKTEKTSKLVPIEENPSEIKTMFGFASQGPSFYSKLSTEENIDHFGSLYKIPEKVRKNNVKALLSSTELSDAHNTLAENLSGGMQRRLGIACSLVHDPKVLILDEPTSDLDPFLRKEIWRLIKKINKQGTTVILTSHFLSEVEHLCDRIAILHQTEIKHIGTPDELKEEYSPNEEIHIELASGKYGKIIKDMQKSKYGISHMGTEEHKLVICTNNSEEALHGLLHSVERNKEKIIDVLVSKPTIREVFESIVKKK